VAAIALLRMLGQLHTGRLRLIDPQGRVQDFGPGGEPQVTLQLASWAPISALMRRGDVGFAQAWIDGSWTTDDLTGLIMLASRNRSVLEAAVFGTWFGQILDRLRHLILRDNTPAGSRRNIAAHYDLGNAFYELWLDETMTYSSACFEGDPQRSLADAQRAKYARALERTAAPQGSRLLEIGCGWGGFAETAAAHGHHVTGLTLSCEQHAWAQSRLQKAGLAAKSDLRLQDYRDIDDGPYDAVCSIEMIEAVGREYWPAYFQSIARLLKPGGRACIQSIVIDDALFERYIHSTDFIQQYIFPGGCLPCPKEFQAQAQRAGLRIVDNMSFGLDYAETLRRWRAKFLEEKSKVLQLGFDTRFMRIWEFYLCYCEAAFEERSIDVVQYTLEKI
jgi:cyclopropane-fatty-acyl-phospholipid synthase